MASIEEILAESENPEYRRVAVARILLRQDLVAQHEALEAELAAAVERDARNKRFGSIEHADEAPAIAERIEEFVASVRDFEHEVRFGALGRFSWQAIVAAHPPTKKQLERIKGAQWNPETFPVALLAASWIDPDRPWLFDGRKKDWAADPEYLRRVSIFERFEGSLGPTMFDLLLDKAFEANTAFAAPKASATVGLVRRASARSASTAAAEASPEAFSSDDS